jgi:methylthioribose-1-phosphate isomerase
MIPTLEWLPEKQALKMIDQTLLPNKLEFLELTTVEEVANSIKNMHVRGAPAIGVTAAFGMVIAGLQYQSLQKEDFYGKMNESAKILKQTRPTAVNLFWAIDLMLKELEENRSLIINEITAVLLKKALQMWDADYQINLKMGEHGATILNDGDTVLTHCNAGSLATVKYGTALAPIRWAIEKQGKKIRVIADETRPRLQGARLTAWELQYDNIPVQVETDSMAGLMMRLGKIQKIIVGADRVVSDTVINKIGTYMVAMAAKYHNIPMYVVAPTSTLSLTETEKDVIIEQRDGDFEVGRLMGRAQQPIVPEGISCINYAFDATPMELITGIITEDGIFTPKELLERYLNS